MEGKAGGGERKEQGEGEGGVVCNKCSGLRAIWITSLGLGHSCHKKETMKINYFENNNC